MAKSDDDRTGLVQKKLTREEREEVANQLSEEITAKEALAAKKSEHVTKWNKQLRIHDQEIRRLNTEHHTGMAYVSPQQELFDAKGKRTTPDRAVVDGTTTTGGGGSSKAGQNGSTAGKSKKKRASKRTPPVTLV